MPPKTSDFYLIFVINKLSFIAVKLTLQILNCFIYR